MYVDDLRFGDVYIRTELATCVNCGKDTSFVQCGCYDVELLLQLQVYLIWG